MGIAVSELRECHVGGRKSAGGIKSAGERKRPCANRPSLTSQDANEKKGT